MPQKPNGAAPHELPLLVHQMKGETQPFLNDVQRQALDAALAAKLSKLSGALIHHLLHCSRRGLLACACGSFPCTHASCDPPFVMVLDGSQGVAIICN